MPEWPVLPDRARNDRKKTVLNTISTDTVKDFYVHAENDIEQGNFESALSRSRNMLEQAFCYAIEKAEAVPVDGKNVERLYRQVKDLYPWSHLRLSLHWTLS